jgi:endonuclease-3
LTEPNPTADFVGVIRSIRKALAGARVPAVSQIAEESPNPFKILISTIISLRTRDEVTAAAGRRLFARADTPQKVAALSESAIEELIFPAGFYHTKARNIRAVAEALLANGGEVPRERERLLELPGVGIKTANLTLSLGYNLPFICVDTHVHRITNRLGWVATKSPEQTEGALMEILPPEYWIEINGLLVGFGQRICTPQSPRCSLCPVVERCPRVGVTRAR